MTRWGLLAGRCLLAALLLAPLVQAEEPAPSLMHRGIRELNAAYDAWDAQAFRGAAETFAAAAAAAPDDYRAHYWEGAAWFHLAIIHLFSRDRAQDAETGEAAVDAGLRALERAVRMNPDFSENYALRGVLRGIKIKLHLWSVFSHGPGVAEDRNRALALNPENPRVHYLTGVSLWFSPEIFGGGAERALEQFLEADRLFAKESAQAADELEPAWGRSTCAAFIGEVYAKRGEAQLAYKYYQKALLVNPQDRLAQLGLEDLARGVPR